MGGVVVALIIIGFFTPSIIEKLPSTLGKLYGVTLFPYLWMFLIAAFVSEYKDYILPFIKKYWFVFFVVLLGLKCGINLDVKVFNYYLFETLLIFVGLLGFSYSFPMLNIKTDISYGVYIYHMTIVNALIELGWKGNNWSLWIVLIVTCFLAWASTVTIGRLSLKQKIN